MAPQYSISVYQSSSCLNGWSVLMFSSQKHGLVMGRRERLLHFFSVRMWKCEFEFERQSDYFLWWWPVRSSYCVKCGYDTSDDRFWELCRRQGVPKVKVQYHGNSLSWCLPPQSVFVSLHFSWKQKNIAFFIVFSLRWSGDILCAYFFFLLLLFLFFGHFIRWGIHGTHNCLTLFKKKKRIEKRTNERKKD